MKKTVEPGASDPRECFAPVSSVVDLVGGPGPGGLFGVAAPGLFLMKNLGGYGGRHEDAFVVLIVDRGGGWVGRL